MLGLSAMYMPIVLSAVFVFIISSVIHMVLSFWHKDDYRQIPGEDRFMDAVRPLNIPPGDYMVPRPSSMEDLRSPAFAEKAKKGPVMVVTVMPNGIMAMGK